MARPRIFVSSTYYDLKHLRSSLENFIESLGYDAVLSEKGDIAYIPDSPLDESCYREVRNADVFVIIIGGRYGSEKSEGKTDLPKGFFDRYDSITRQEYKSAVEKDLPIYILIEKSVYSDFETYLRNKNNNTISYAHVDSVNIFSLVEEVLSQPRNNPIQQFDRYSDIEVWLKEQWAGLFRELLTRLSSQQQIASLAAQVTELAEINKTLKTYLEEVVSKIAPEESARLIKTESKRLQEVKEAVEILKNPLVRHLVQSRDVPLEVVQNAIAEAKSVEDFVERVSNFDSGQSGRSPLLVVESLNTYLKALMGHDHVVHDLNNARKAIGCASVSFKEQSQSSAPSANSRTGAKEKPKRKGTSKKASSKKA
jgi:Domain of unknown function (DUF4062)